VNDVWLVRHGETAWSANGQHTGRTDIPLTERGRERAQRLAEHPGLAGDAFALVLCSPLLRARDTAALAGFGDRAQPDPDLCEWDYGDMEGKRTSDIRRTHPGWDIWSDGVVNGETVDQVGGRADRVIARCRAANGPSLLFAHGHVLRILAARWLGQPAVDGRLYALDAAAVSVLGWERERPVVARWNLTL
jgi:broad specificity phosphatase PhoE